MKIDAVLPPAETVECHNCGRETRWERSRSGNFQRCEGCGDRFPCASRSCGHLDCREVRAELRKAKR